MTSPDVPKVKPFLKWVGSKRRLVPDLLARMPKAFGAYHEPFVGGGSLFWTISATSPGPFHLSDMNSYLVATYRAVRDHVEPLISLLREMPYEKTFYYAQRDRQRTGQIAALDDVQIGAWFIYMNRAGFNGLWRVNQSGQCNNPFGRYTNPTICDAENLRACSSVLSKVDTRIRHIDFSAAVADVEPGDLVYFDPPYIPLSDTSDFTGYTEDGFDHEDQLRLRDCALKLKSRGVHVVLSNSDTPVTRKIYDSPLFTLESVMAARSINSDGAKRQKISELIIS